MLDFAGGNVGAGGHQIELFIVKGGSAILDMQFGYDEKDARGFEVFVGEAIGAKQFGSAHLEIDGIDAVVDDAALVGLAVSRLNGYRAAMNGRFFGKIHISLPPKRDFIHFHSFRTKTRRNKVLNKNSINGGSVKG